MKMRTLYRFVYSLLVIAASATTMVSSAQERQMGGVGITVFTDQNFRGKSATFRQDVPDLARFGGLNDKVSSLRVGPGEQWEVCEHSNYRGRCVVVSGDEPDLRTNSWSDIISSFRRVDSGTVPPNRPGPPSQGDWYIVLYDQTTYRGNPTNYNGPVANLSRRAQSVTIGRGVWELCEGIGFSGRCVTLDTSVPDLSTYNLRNRVASVRPIRSEERPEPPTVSDWYIVLYDQRTYRGNPTNYNGPVSDLGGYNKRAQSVTIGKGVWQLCEGKDFTGRCVTLNQSVPDLGAYNLRKRVSSVRPVMREPR